MTCLAIVETIGMHSDGSVVVTMLAAWQMDFWGTLYTTFYNWLVGLVTTMGT